MRVCGFGAHSHIEILIYLIGRYKDGEENLFWMRQIENYIPTALLINGVVVV
jgi:hypothetical protein